MNKQLGMDGEWLFRALGDIAILHTEQVNPANEPHKLFQHFSLPAYDGAREPVIEPGSAIGSHKFSVPDDAVLVSKLNPRIPRVWEPTVVTRNAVASTEFLVLRPRNGTDRRFLRYLCLAPPVRAEFQARVTGTSGSHQRVQPEDALTIEAEIPVDLAEQRAIAHILGTLDDKIELNRRMNETLEAMARALFKSWFVDFDPVRAKADLSAACLGATHRQASPDAAQAEGPGLPKEIADLFPDRLVDSELGEIPEGWDLVSLGDVLELAYGKTLKKENRRPAHIPVFGSNGQVGWHDEELATGPGIIVGRKGNPGVISWAPTDFFAIDTTFYVLRKDKCRSLYFLFYALSGHDLPSLAADSAVPGLNRNFVYSNLQVIPPPNVLDTFDRIVKASFDRQNQNECESRTLAALRDTLLPKLISGELREKDADIIVDTDAS